jgi:hypothetical protein
MGLHVSGNDAAAISHADLDWRPSVIRYLMGGFDPEAQVRLR